MTTTDVVTALLVLVGWAWAFYKLRDIGELK